MPDRDFAGYDDEALDVELTETLIAMAGYGALPEALRDEGLVALRAREQGVRDEQARRARLGLRRRGVRGTPKPARVAALPCDPRGYPIFFTTWQGSDGGPYPTADDWTFRAINAVQVARCARGRLCGVCGQDLGWWLWFVGGPLSAHNRLYGDPPMHEECLRYALEVCPHLSVPGHRRRADPGDPAYMRVGVDVGKPDLHVLYKARDYRFDAGTCTFEATRPVALEFRTPEGELVSPVEGRARMANLVAAARVAGHRMR